MNWNESTEFGKSLYGKVAVVIDISRRYNRIEKEKVRKGSSI